LYEKIRDSGLIRDGEEEAEEEEEEETIASNQLKDLLMRRPLFESNKLNNNGFQMRGAIPINNAAFQNVFGIPSLPSPPPPAAATKDGEAGRGESDEE
jgi:hypothetical protein